ncbi:MAG: hypothetical protein ACNYZG_05595 [Gammaproteobacteria bacterium]
MDKKTEDTGVILVLLESFEKQRLPRIIEIKLKLEYGDIINEFELEYLSEALHDVRMLFPYLDRHPEYQALVAKIIHFYKLVLDEALANER